MGAVSTTRRLVPWALLVLMACDTSITNPGPVSDEALDNAVAHQALVNGIERATSRALNVIAYTGSIIARELTDGGRVGGDLGITRLQRTGILAPGVEEADVHWLRAQQARWVGEDGVRRLRETLGEDFGSSALAARALLFTGYANRILGENMCEAVIDGGPAVDRRVSFERAEANFSEGIAIAERANQPDIANAARAGRAATRVWLGDWAGAVADASAVPPTFVFQARYSALEVDQNNRFFASQATQGTTVWGTFYDAYFTETGDPRTPWSQSATTPLTILGDPWHFQTKHDRREAPIRLSSGREMRLILAEARLRDGDAAGGLEILNQLRESVGAPPWPAGGLEAAWAALKRERGIELWLEGRRLGDLHRWLAEGTPGATDDMTGRSTCFPIGQTELDTNPNLRNR